MSVQDTLIFRQFDPVTGPPTIDGFAKADQGVETAENGEPGYVNGSQANLGTATIPPVVVQCVKHDNFIVIGINHRGGTSFNDTDGVVIGLKEFGGAAAGPQNLINLFPVWGDFPSPPSTPVSTASFNLGTGYGAANRDPMNHNQHLDDDPLFPSPPNADPHFSPDVRTNKPLRFDPSFFRRAGSSGVWTPGIGMPSGFLVKARSWRPSVATGSPNEVCWSIEVKIPIMGGGANWVNLSDDFGLFVGAVRTIRRAEDGGDGMMSGPNDFVYTEWVAEFTFPPPAPMALPVLQGDLTAGVDIPIGSFGHGLIKAANDYSGDGVRFKNGNLGIGRRPADNTASALANEIKRDVTIPAPPGKDNHIVAQLENIGPVVSVNATVRMANWGLSSPDPQRWSRPNGCENPSPSTAIPANAGVTPGFAETTNIWLARDVGTEYAPPKTHQCMWVQLEAGPTNPALPASPTNTIEPVNFSMSSARRNMDFTGFSEEVREAEISGKGYKPPENGAASHEFLMFTRCRKIVVKELVSTLQELSKQELPASLFNETVNIVGGALQFAADVESPDVDKQTGELKLVDKKKGPDWSESVVYLWINEGFRKTGRFVEIHGKKMEILDPSPGDFGLIAHHRGIADNVSWSFEGPGMAKLGDGVYGLKVPHNGVLTIKTRVGAESDGPSGDQSTQLPYLPNRDWASQLPDVGKPGETQPEDPKPGICGLIALGIVGVPLAWAASQLFA
jgi:hypothetical protein